MRKTAGGVRVVDRNDIYPDVAALLAEWAPVQPVYCIYPASYRDSTAEFLDGFPGRVLYAVKANNDPQVVALLNRLGVRHFDCASLDEIALVNEIDPDANCYLMNPVRLEGAAREAQAAFGTRHFMIDHRAGLRALVAEIEASNSVIFARMAVHHASAMEDLSQKFGAPPADVPELLAAIADSGAEAALAFNVGSGVTSPDAYRHALRVAKRALERTPVPIRLLDIGGGFPRSYPGFEVPPLRAYFDAIEDEAASLPLAGRGELLAEPGRALAAPGMSVLTKVLLKKDEAVYINDGMYGSFWELRFKGHKRHPLRAYRNGRLLGGAVADFHVFGPTCDSSDKLPEPLALPREIDAGDYIEFGKIGAYSVSGRTRFNGFGVDGVVSLDSPAARPPQ